MRRLYVAGPLVEGARVRLEGPVAHRIARVLRLRPGERIVLFDGSGVEAVAELTSATSSRAEAHVLSIRPGAAEPPVRLTLCQSVVKGGRFEWVLEKGTEIGVARFVPILTERNVARPGEGTKLDRWRRIVVEAAEQCGRSVVPEVTPPVVLEEALRGLELPALVPHEAERVVTVRAAVEALDQPRALSILVGPEGGFTPQEVRQAVSRGARTVSLGPRILRSETAGIVAATLALAYLGALDPEGPPVRERSRVDERG